ncbi:hypothetical protein PTTG_03861 [Puccinia triticina 1-1 BBBD Race 1]|uniref:Intimal thickness related receptor IRP domain-containing protein n=1 Tax=Puccinia triticina (isolate 1-1 / race 1 (BBBD)) TaxID=630390 RepID=A0A180GGH6_PUCT1|nr:hypothetical protein PTTG_03861 [Puccinia triticina 1-1 BBBD Race 1]
MKITSSLPLLLLLLWSSISLSNAYQVLISDTDDLRQVCSGMWQKFAKSRDPYIEIIFGPASSGQLALVVYEWQDAKWLGINPSNKQAENSWQEDRVYVCTLDAIAQSLCTKAELGEFIISPLPSDVKRESLNIWTQRIKLEAKPNPASSSSDTGTQMGSGPYRYNVTKTGYYCVGAVPLTVGLPSTSNTTYSTYTGVVAFENVFKGNLPAGEYPKVAFYGFVAVIYVFVGILWGYNCHRHRTEILPVQHYISGSIVFLIVELTTVFGYYKYLNDFGNPSMTRALLVLVSILSAARNALSFFMLLIVSLGYSIVKDSLGSVMLRVRLLAIAHFIFGVVYAIGMAVFPFETAGLWIFFMVFPLAFTLTGFMMWIMAALAHTIQDLEARKQTFKTQMFVRLHRILIGAAIVIVIFFFVSSVSFSNRLQQDFAPDTWRTRWFLLDGWLSLLYMVCFVSIAYLWRPTERNRYLAMSDELAQDEEAADEYDDQATARDGALGEEDDGGKEWVPQGDGRDAVPLQLRRVGEETVVFDIGEDDDDGEDLHKSKDQFNGNDNEHRPLRRSTSTERPPDYH